MSTGPWDELDQAAWAQAARMAELGVLSASMLHEIRQPLFAIKALSQLARGDGEMSPRRLEQLLDQVHHMETIVEAWSEFGRGPETVALFDLNEPVRKAVEMLAHRGRSSGAPLEAELSDTLLLVRGRRGAARQVVVNLISNALDAVELVRGGRVIVRTLDDGPAVRLVVEDSGPGVPQEVRERLFQPFVTTKPPGRGTGLGLYIVQKLVSEANGILRLDCPTGGGTRIEVELPRAA